jgi:hypothetical protein
MLDVYFRHLLRDPAATHTAERCVIFLQIINLVFNLLNSEFLELISVHRNSAKRDALHFETFNNDQLRNFLSSCLNHVHYKSYEQAPDIQNYP